MKLTAKDLHTLAPLGAYVAYSDGKPKPPQRFNKKLKEWDRSNSWGYFIKAGRGDPTKSYHRPGFALQQDHGHFIINTHFGLEGDLSYEVTMPPAGAILAYHDHSDLGHALEISHVWQNLNAARTWAWGHGRNGKPDYRFATCGNKYFIVTPNGSLMDYMPADACPVEA